MNDPSLAGRGWVLDYLWPTMREGVFYTAAVFCLFHAALMLWLTTTEGLLELGTCFGLLAMEVGTILSETFSRRADRRGRALRFLGAVDVLDEENGPGGRDSWKQIPGFNLKPGMVLRLSANSVVPADVRWLRGSPVLCDTTFATNQDHRAGGGVGGDSGEDLSGFVRLGATKTTKQAKEGKNSVNNKSELRRRKGGGAASTEGDDSNAGNDDDEGSVDYGPYARVPAEDECLAGAKVLAVASSSSKSPSSSSKGFAVCQVLAVGAHSVGWKHAAAHALEEDGWRRDKFPKASPSKLGAWSMFGVCAAASLLVPHLLSKRPNLESHDASGGQLLFRPSAAQLLRSLLAAVSDQLGLEPDFFTLPSWIISSAKEQEFAFVPLFPDAAPAVTTTGEQGEFDHGFTPDASSSETRGSDGGDSDSDLLAVAALTALVAIDQCRALIHAGLVVVAHGTMGTRLLMQSVESGCQRLLAKRGCLLKHRVTGITAQRCAEVDTLVLCHSSPRPVSAASDASLVARLRSSHGIDVKLLKVQAPSANELKQNFTKETTASSGKSGTTTSPSSSPSSSSPSSSSQEATELKFAAAAEALGVSAEELKAVAKEEEAKKVKGADDLAKTAKEKEAIELAALEATIMSAAASSGQGGNNNSSNPKKNLEASFSLLLKSLTLPDTIHEVGTFATHPRPSSDEKESETTTTVASASGLLVPLSIPDLKAFAKESLAVEVQRQTYAKALELRKKLGPHKVMLPPKPAGPLLPRPAVAAGCQVVRQLQRENGRKVMVTCDDAFDGRTLPLLHAAHVGVVTGNLHLTEKKKGAAKSAPPPPPPSAKPQQQQQQQQKKKGQQKQKTATPSPTGAAGKVEEEEEDAPSSQARSGGDIALATGLPLGLLPLADMLVVCRAAVRIEHAVRIRQK